MLKRFILAAILISTSAFGATDYFNPIYNQNTFLLYDISRTADSEAYKLATVEAKQTLLKQTFHENLHNAYCGQAQDVVDISLPPLVMFLSWKLFSSATPPVNHKTHKVQIAPSFQNNYFISNMLTTIWGAFVYPIAFYSAYSTTETITGYGTSIKRCLVSTTTDDLHKLELKYIADKPSYTKQWQKIIEENFINARSDFRMKSQYLQESTAKSKYLDFAEKALALPTKSAPIQLDRAKLTENLKQYETMQDFNDNNAFKQLLYFCETIAVASKQENSNLKAPVYLYGTPGSGKTEAVRIMANSLDMPLIKINLGEIKSVAELKGYTNIPQEGGSVSRVGLIAEKLIALREKGINTDRVMVFFDEADRILNQIKDGEINEMTIFMLELLDGSTQSFENPFFKADINIKNISFVLAGNSRLKTEALQNRLETIYFGGYPLEYREEAGRNRFLVEAIVDYDNMLTLVDFSEEDLIKVDMCAKTEHRKLQTSGSDLEIIESEPGFREQKRMIHKIVHQKAMSKALEQK